MWTYYSPTKIVFGVGSFGKIREYSEKFKPKKILIVTGRSAMKRLGLTDRLVSNLKGIETVVFDRVKPNPCCATVDEGVGLAKKEKCDLVIALGGGSTMDAAKTIAIIAENGGNARDYLYKKREFKKRGLPFIAIPTTSGTASEMNKYAVITDEKNKVKKAMRDELLCPAIALIDPKLTVFISKEITASTGLDSLCHAIESYWSDKATAITEMFSLKAVGLVNENLERAYADGNDLDARTGLSLASLFAGFAFGNTGTTDIHGLGYPVTTHFGLTHGFACAVFMPPFMEYNAPEIEEKILNIAKALGRGSVREGIGRVRELMKEVNAPARLGEVGVKEKDLDLIIKEGFTKKNNPRKISERQLKDMLRGML